MPLNYLLLLLFLCLNDSKTEVLLIGSDHLLRKIQKQNLTIGDEAIVPSDKARNIGAIFDKVLSMNVHIAQTCENAWYHLRQIGEIQSYLHTEATQTLMHSFVTSRLDVVNGLLYGIPKQQVSKLQFITVTNTIKDFLVQ